MANQNEWEKYLKQQQERAALTLPEIQSAQNVQGYTPGASVTQSYQQYQNQAAAKPGAYQGQYDQQIKNMYDNILNRKDFKYDMNADALYHQYKDRYLQQGKMAMQDTIGQAAAMTGGYGNSYAATAGQQMYNQHLTALNDQLPALMDRAYQQYRDKGQDMYQQLGMMQGLDDRDYGRYRDNVSDWQSQLNQALQMYYGERDFDYGGFVDQTNWTRADQQRQEAAARADQQRQEDWERELQLRDEAWARDDAIRAEQAAAAASRSSGGGKKNNDEEELFKMLLEVEEELKKTQAKNSQYYKALSQGVSMF